MNRNKQSGFSLVELLVATAILLFVVGTVMSYISIAQRRFDNETTKMDMTQESREFMDQMSRDLHMVGSPHPRMFSPGVLINPWYDDQKVAAGIVSVSNTQLRFEGDMDNDGTVDAITYELVRDFPPPPAVSVSCPCRIHRLRTQKQAGGPLAQPQPFFFMAAQGIINSGGAIPLAAQPGNFAAYTGERVFRVYDANGTEIALPVDINGPDNPATGRRWVFDIRTVRVTLNVLGAVTDNQTKLPPVITMTSTTKINNF